MSIPRWIRRLQTWTKVGANRTASPYFWIVDLLKPPKCPIVSRGVIRLAYIHSHMNLHMCAKFGANRHSRLVAFPEFLLRLVRLFAAVRADWHKNTPKNNICTSKIINSGPNMQTSTSLTFFTAIFVVFSGVLAEELMTFCRHVRTELYI